MTFYKRYLTKTITLLTLGSTVALALHSASTFAEDHSPLQKAVDGCFAPYASDLSAELDCLLDTLSRARLATPQRNDEISRCSDAYRDDLQTRHSCVNEVVAQAKADFDNLNKRALGATGGSVIFGVVGTFVYRFFSGAAGVMIVPVKLLKKASGQFPDDATASAPKPSTEATPAS